MHRNSSPLPYLAALAVLAACVMFQRPATRKVAPHIAPPVPAVAPEAPSPPDRRRVVLLSVDGMSAALVDRMPNLARLFEQGAGTKKALVPPGATTAISHAALLTGADPRVSGVDCEPDEKACRAKFAYEHNGYHGSIFRWTPLQVKDTLFTAVEHAGYRAVAAVQKGKIVGFFRPDGDETGILSTNDGKKIVETGCKALDDEKIRLVVLHLKMIDDAGHRAGWLSERQFREAKIIDGQLQEIRDCIDRDNAAGHPVSTVLIVTADHGGRPGHGHGFNDDDDRLVPWVIVGPGIAKGVEIAERSGLSPIMNGGTHPSILLIDTVPTVLALLGIPETSIPTLSREARPIEDLLIHAAQ